MDLLQHLSASFLKRSHRISVQISSDTFDFLDSDTLLRDV